MAKCVCVQNDRLCVSCRPSNHGRCQNLRVNIGSSQDGDGACDDLDRGGGDHLVSRSIVTDSLVGSVDQDSPSLGDQVNNDVDNNVVNVNELMYRAYGATLSVGPCDPTRLGDWQKRWDRISRFSRKQYDVPSGAVGRRYTEQLSLEVQHLTLSNFPADRVLVFSAVMLQRDRLVRKAVDIRRVLERRLKMLANEEFDTLMNESSRCDNLHKPRGNRVDDNQHGILSSDVTG